MRRNGLGAATTILAVVMADLSAWDPPIACGWTATPFCLVASGPCRLNAADRREVPQPEISAAAVSRSAAQNSYHVGRWPNHDRSTVPVQIRLSAMKHSVIGDGIGSPYPMQTVRV